MLKSSTDYISKYEYGCGYPHLKPQKQHSFILNGNEPLFSFGMNNNFKLPHRWFINLSGNVSTNAAQSGGRKKCMGNLILIPLPIFPSFLFPLIHHL